MQTFYVISLLKILFFVAIHAQLWRQPEFGNPCQLRNGSPGVCRDIRACPAAQANRHRPVTCHRNAHRHFVCCKVRAALTLLPFPEPPTTPKQESVTVKGPEPPTTPKQDSVAVKACKLYHPPIREIISGYRTKPHEFPYMVALGWESLQTNAYDYKCGGVLISNDFVLTAAHCTEVNGLEPIVALLGGNNLTDASVTPIRITQVIKYPLYKTNLAYNDIALLKLEQSIEIGNNLRPACLEDSPSDLENQNVTAVGYGHTVFAGAGSSNLLKAYLRLLSHQDCERHYAEESSLPTGLVETQICAKDPEQIRDTCQGDSGGPLINLMKSQYKPYIVGITSFGQGCATETPGVYTRVYPYVSWIENIVWPNGINLKYTDIY